MLYTLVVSNQVDCQEEIVIQAVMFLVEIEASVFLANGNVIISRIVQTGVTKLIARILHWVCETTFTRYRTNLEPVEICPFLCANCANFLFECIHGTRPKMLQKYKRSYFT